MRRVMFGIWFSLWPLLLGAGLPYITFPRHLIFMNIFWEVIYGIGFWGVDKTVGLYVDSPFVAVGVFIWPIAVSAAMFFCGWKVLQASSRMRLAIVSALLLSSLLTVSLQRALQPPISDLPTF
jgi:hypothetical protein